MLYISSKTRVLTDFFLLIPGIFYLTIGKKKKTELTKSLKNSNAKVIKVENKTIKSSEGRIQRVTGCHKDTQKERWSINSSIHFLHTFSLYFEASQPQKYTNTPAVLSNYLQRLESQNNLNNMFLENIKITHNDSVNFAFLFNLKNVFWKYSVKISPVVYIPSYCMKYLA